MKRICSFLLAFFVMTSLSAHEILMSMANMDISQTSIKTTVRIYADELETVLHNKYNIHGWLGTPYEHDDARKLLAQYIQEAFTFAANGKQIPIQITKTELQDDSMLFTFSAKIPKNTTQLTIKNRILVDFYSKQKNMLIINHKNAQQGFTFTRENDSITIPI